ncbi:MAG: NAD(+)/NADH kinase [Clostridiales bacterium]|nr:NAD(+)/NADH kinase [Candidatus Crickella merdequi]
MALKVYIFKNNKELTTKTYNQLLTILNDKGFEVVEDESSSPDLYVCIGGDGTFLSFVHKLDFPSKPIIGINTGHLGFFQESMPDNMANIIDDFLSGDYKIQTLKPVEAIIETKKESFIRIGVNELMIRGPLSHVTQFSVEIEKTKIEDFSGDGLLISTPAGSTAYNYSLGGSLVAPELDLLQITPVAPMNTNAYRCFHSSVLLPGNETITITGIGRMAEGTIILSFDGKTHEFKNVKRIRIRQSKKQLQLIRFSDYDYWDTLAKKLL